MHKTRTMLVALAGGLLWLAAHPTVARADDGSGLSAGIDAWPWSRWQARVSVAANPPSWRSSFGAVDSQGTGLNPVRRSGGIESFSLLGDYYFARPFAAVGGLRATSGLIVGPRSPLLSIAQPGLAAGGLFSADSRGFGQPALLRSRDSESAAALPYIGLGYTGRTAGGALSLSADLGMIGQSLGDAPGRAATASLRSADESGRDGARRLPMLQLGMLYSF